MEVSIVDKNSYLVEFSPTECRIFRDLLDAANHPPEKILASMIFQALAVEHSNLKLTAELEAWEYSQISEVKLYNPADRD